MKKIFFLSAILLVSQANAMNHNCCPYPSLWQRMKIRTAYMTNKIMSKFNGWFGSKSAQKQQCSSCCVKKYC